MDVEKPELFRHLANDINEIGLWSVICRNNVHIVFRPRSRIYYGVCYYERHLIALYLESGNPIHELSYEDLLDTLIHECCHVLSVEQKNSHVHDFTFWRFYNFYKSKAQKFNLL